MFCEICGRILLIERSIEEKNIGLCSCGFVKQIEIIGVSQILKKEEEKGEGVILEDKSKGFPNICKKCGHEGCDVFDLGAPYSDESEIFLFKCKKCGYVERYADGTGNS